MPDIETSRITYAFGHLVASYNPEDPHHADSGDLAEDEFRDMGLEDSLDLLHTLAEEVASNYQYTGEANDLERRIERGES